MEPGMGMAESENHIDWMTIHPLCKIFKDDLRTQAHGLLGGKRDMRGHQTVRGVQNRRCRIQRWFIFKDIKGGTGNHTVFKGIYKIFFHDNRAACNIDQKSRGLHHRKLFCVDHATGRVVQRAMQNHNVRAAEQFFLRDLFNIICCIFMPGTALCKNVCAECME